MKKSLPRLVFLLFALTILYPLGALLASCLGYKFTLFSIPTFSLILASLSMVVFLFDLICKPSYGKFLQILLAIFPPLTLIHAALCILNCTEFRVAIGAVLSVGCGCYLAIRHGKPVPLKLVFFSLAMPLALPIGFLTLMGFLFGDIGHNTVVKTLPSPSGTYYAQVVDNDQGAMGGRTDVVVYEKFVLNLLLFQVEKKPQTVYTGHWGEFETMQIHWRSDSCLVIDGREYPVSLAGNRGYYDLGLETNLNTSLPMGGTVLYQLFAPMGKDAKEYAVIQFPKASPIADHFPWMPMDEPAWAKCQSLLADMELYLRRNRESPIPTEHLPAQDALYATVGAYPSLSTPYAFFLYTPKDMRVYVLIHLT